MHLSDVVAPTIAIAASWFCIAALIAGCGYLTRRGLLRALLFETTPGLCRADLWIGLGALIAFLQLWSLFDAIGWTAWIAPLGLGLVGIALGCRRLPTLSRSRSSIAVGGITLVAVLWLANRSLGHPGDYDFGLYHLGAIEYASEYGTIPGLANLHERLGAGNPHLLLVSFLDNGPWSGVGFRITNGLLAVMLLVDIGSRFMRGRSPVSRVGFSRRMAALLAPATLLAVAGGVGTAVRLSSPNLDLAAFVLVVVGSLYLAESVELGFDSSLAAASTASFAVAGGVRPQYWLLAVLATGFIVASARRRPTPKPVGLGPALALVCAVPGLIVAGAMGRQAVLSGYPLFPLTVGGLPVDWRVPSSVVEEENRWVAAWARWPGRGPDEVLGSWSWVGPWLSDRARDVDVIGPLLLLVCLVPAIVWRSPSDTQWRRDRLWPMLAVVVPSGVTLVVWFALAPDPRFALAPLWLMPVALVAWSLPVARKWIGQLAVAAVVLATIGVVAYRDALRPPDSDAGLLGGSELPTPQLEAFTTRSGLHLSRPADGGDRCWRVMLCTPYPNPDLRARGGETTDGFTVGS